MRLLLSVCIAILILGVSGCNLTAPAPTPFPTPDLPQVTFLAPENRTRIFEGSTLVIDLVAQDDTAGIARIEFLIDEILMQEGAPESGNEPIFRVTTEWQAQGIGNHTLSAVAYRPDGTPSDRTIIVVEVVPRTDDEG